MSVIQGKNVLTYETSEKRAEAVANKVRAQGVRVEVVKTRAGQYCARVPAAEFASISKKIIASARKNPQLKGRGPFQVMVNRFAQWMLVCADNEVLNVRVE